MDSFENIEILAYHGLISGAESSGQPVDFTLKDIANWLDDSGMGKIQEILAAFGDSQSVTDETEESETEGKKILRAS